MVWHQVRTLISRQSRDMARPLRWGGAQASRAEHGSCGTRDPSFTYKKHAQDDPERLTCNTCGFVVSISEQFVGVPRYPEARGACQVRGFWYDRGLLVGVIVI
jgi:ribosomal protein L44E